MPNPLSSPDDTIIRTKIPVFAPKRIISIDEFVEWTPDEVDRCFMLSGDSAFTLGADSSSGSVYVNLVAGQVIGIQPGMTFTFNTAAVLAVM